MGNASKIDGPDLLKSTLEHPLGSQNRGQGVQNERKFKVMAKMRLQGYFGRAWGELQWAPVVDADAAAMGTVSSSKWCLRRHVFSLFPTSILYYFFHWLLMISGLGFVINISWFVIAGGVPFPSMILTRLFSLCGLPSGSKNLRRYAFYTMNTMVLAHSSFSEKSMIGLLLHIST